MSTTGADSIEAHDRLSCPEQVFVSEREAPDARKLSLADTEFVSESEARTTSGELSRGSRVSDFDAKAVSAIDPEHPPLTPSTPDHSKFMDLEEEQETGGTVSPDHPDKDALEDEAKSKCTTSETMSHLRVGVTYVGQTRHGGRHGVGVYTSKSKTYDGEWVDDKRHGRGKQVWSDGRCYEGDFDKGNFHGFGRMQWDSGPDAPMVYLGQYENNLKHGAGKFCWADGRAYEGQWEKGLRHGAGVYTFKDGKRRKGIWKDNVLQEWLDAVSDSEDDL